MQFFEEILKMPIARRLLLSGNEKFVQFRTALQRKYGNEATDIMTNPRTFIKYTLWLIMEKSPEPREVWENIKGKELSDIRTILINHQNEILAELHKNNIVSPEGNGRINMYSLGLI